LGWKLRVTRASNSSRRSGGIPGSGRPSTSDVDQPNIWVAAAFHSATRQSGVSPIMARGNAAIRLSSRLRDCDELRSGVSIAAPLRFGTILFDRNTLETQLRVCKITELSRSSTQQHK